MKLKSLKTILKISVSSVLALSMLAGCGGSSSSQPSSSSETASVSSAEPKQGGEITIGVTSFADTLEPTEQYFSWVVSRYGVGECLVRFDENGEMTPCLAESWNNSEDGLTWTFKIRQGVKFSNGDEMTPELVKASIERTAAKSNRVAEFFDLKSIDVDVDNLI